MNVCDRCGIETDKAGWCDDCVYVEAPEGPEKEDWEEPEQVITNGYVNSRRAPGERMMEDHIQIVIDLTLLGLPLGPIAMQTGFSTDTVHHTRVRLREQGRL